MKDEQKVMLADITLSVMKLPPEGQKAVKYYAQGLIDALDIAAEKEKA